MDQNNCVNIIKDFLSKESFYVNSFLGNKSEAFRKAFGIMLQHINDMENEKEINDKYDKDVIIDTVNFIKYKTLEEPIVPDFQIFGMNWSLFVFNWNNNVLKDEKLGKDCNVISRFLQQHYTITESIEILKSLNKKAQQMKGWNPPAFEIAKHFVKYLDEE